MAGICPYIGSLGWAKNLTRNLDARDEWLFAHNDDEIAIAAEFLRRLNLNASGLSARVAV